MELSKICLIFSLAVMPLLADELDEIKLHALYLMQQGATEESIEKYREFVDLKGRGDFEALGQMGLILMQKGIGSQDQQTVMMTLFGAGLSGSAGALEILEKGMEHLDPQVQLLALHFIAKFDDDRVSEILNRAMTSNYLGIRMEAAYYLAQRKHPHAVGQIEGLMYRLPPSFKPFFPPLFAIMGTNDATCALKRLIEDIDPHTRIESILNVAHLGRDDFLPLLRKRLTHTHIAELEATIFAIGLLKDSTSIQKLKKLTNSPTDTIRLAASLALCRLGDRSAVPLIIELAEQSNLFAISALGSISETENTLAKLVTSTDLQVRMNAAIALLQRRDPRCLSALCEILISDSRDLAFHPFHSLGKTFTAIKAVPSAELRSKDPTLDLSYSLSMREHYLKETANLPEDAFLEISEKIFSHYQNDLIPTTISLLENLETPGALSLLQQGSRKISAPLIRDYCHLSLYRLNQEGPHEEYVNHWIAQQKNSNLIQLRQLLPWKYRINQSDYTLTAEETSRLLVEAFLSVASRRDEKSISFLLEAIQSGNPNNRYALMGLLMKATE
jgi:HEAT repeat protein